MECTVCNKNVNEMTYICDNCGTQLLKEKVELSFDTIDEMISQPVFENRYPDDFEEEIRRAYFLSNQRQTIHGESLNNYKNYLDYFYLRLLYEEDKYRFEEENYDKEEAKVILTAFKKKAISNNVVKILKNHYKDDYVQHKIPDELCERVPRVYATKEYNVSAILKGRTPSQILMIWFTAFVSYYFIFSVVSGAIAGFMYVRNVLPVGANISPEMLQEYLTANPIYLIVPLVLAIAVSTYKLFNEKKVDIIHNQFKKNKGFKRQIKKEILPLIKTLKKKKVFK